MLFCQSKSGDILKEWLDYYKIPVIYAATKADKIKPREKGQQDIYL
jgi:GTP-binding protein EngB required for normal cell division